MAYPPFVAPYAYPLESITPIPAETVHALSESAVSDITEAMKEEDNKKERKNVAKTTTKKTPKTKTKKTRPREMLAEESLSALNRGVEDDHEEDGKLPAKPSRNHPDRVRRTRNLSDV